MSVPAATVPSVSVVIPTYKRPELLCRAIDSVLAQTWQDFEVVITDDEPVPGKAWDMLTGLAARDHRIRPARNPGPRGQVGNVNYAVSLCRAPWVKPCFDDDVLRPTCLEEFMAAVRARPGVSLVRCLADHYVSGVLRRAERAHHRPYLERLDAQRALLAVYLQDVEIGMPTQIMISKAAFDDGARMNGGKGLVISVDWWWYIALLQRGDLLLLNAPLIEEHQGDHATVTAGGSLRLISDELRALRGDVHGLIMAEHHPPSLSAVRSMVWVLEALVSAQRRRFLDALRALPHAMHPLGWWLAARFCLRRAYPGRFEIVRREAIAGDVDRIETSEQSGVAA